MQKIMTEEFFILLVADAVIDKDQSLSIFNQQTAKGPVAHIVLVGRVDLVPDGFGYHAKHGAAVELKVSTFDRI